MIKLKKIFNIFIVLILLFTASSCSFSKPILDGKSYDTIEELYEDYKKEHDVNLKIETDCFPIRLAFYINIEDKWFVFSTYSNPIHSKERENVLSIFVVCVNEENKYEVLTHDLAVKNWGCIILNNNYNDYLNDQYYVDCKINNMEKSVGFAYKGINDTYNLYYDGIKMEEKIFINPFTNEEFILCYLVSDVTYTFFQKLFVKKEDRHSLETK